LNHKLRLITISMEHDTKAVIYRTISQKCDWSHCIFLPLVPLCQRNDTLNYKVENIH
jgi:hypothetical protein